MGLKSKRDVVSRTVTFRVPGDPVTKGSTRSFNHAKTGAIITMDSNAKRLEPWEATVKLAAAEAWDDKLTNGPVGLIIAFGFRRPKNHYGTGRNAEVLKASAPMEVITFKRNDLDKLLRAVMDALTGVVYIDDAQVAYIEASKLYADKPGVRIQVKI